MKNPLFIACIAIGIIGISIVLGIVCSSSTKSKETPQVPALLTSSDQRFTITVPASLSIRSPIPNEDHFTLDFYCAGQEMYVYATSIPKSHEVNLEELACEDKSLFLSSKEQVQDSSSVMKNTIKDYTVWEYFVLYFAPEYGKDFYSNVVWIETDTYIYVLNLEVVASNREAIQSYFSQIKDSFTEL